MVVDNIGLILILINKVIGLVNETLLFTVKEEKLGPGIAGEVGYSSQPSSLEMENPFNVSFMLAALISFCLDL